MLIVAYDHILWPSCAICVASHEGDVPGCTNNQTIYDDPTSGVARCPEKSWLVMVFCAVYLILTNILLINLLIAMFRYTRDHDYPTSPVCFPNVSSVFAVDACYKSVMIVNKQ